MGKGGQIRKFTHRKWGYHEERSKSNAELANNSKNLSVSPGRAVSLEQKLGWNIKTFVLKYFTFEGIFYMVVQATYTKLAIPWDKDNMLPLGKTVFLNENHWKYSNNDSSSDKFFGLRQCEPSYCNKYMCGNYIENRGYDECPWRIKKEQQTVVLSAVEQSKGNKWGIVKWFDEKKGYGFIQREGEKAYDLFVHYTSINIPGLKTLSKGARVSFDIEVGKKGLIAKNVTLL